MNRTLKSIALAIALATAGGAVHAQDFTFGWNPRSGDVWMDTWLGDMNRYGTRYRDPFVDEMVRYHGAPRDLVTDLLVRRRWAPGDVFMACNIAAIIGRPCRYVVEAYDRDHGHGWGNIAKQMGIKPGSPEFHRLKKGFVPTYDRWARPITLDVELERAYPNRGKGHGKNGKSGNGNGKSQAGKSGNAHGGDKAHGASAKSEQGKGKGKSGGQKSKSGDKGGGNGKGKG